jgi:hypothetical protein
MTTSVPTAGLRQNRLAREQSPYLLQHQHNPVDWYAWGEEAFSKARRERKPVFLSIGYSTCHWCHVMERESFENPEVAAFLNEHFVSVKVDREERPDIDKIYMTFVQATTGQGGWPLTAFLDGELRPFYGGTYFPPDNRRGRPGLLQLLNQIQQLWQTRRADLEQSAAQMHARLVEAMDREDSGELPLTEKLLQNAAAVFKHAYDAENGGFGGAPKFPQPSQPQFLLRYGVRFGDADAIRMVLHTCDRMAAGGIHDQLGGGFARYSVDARWLVPHFEKMLYDNAQLAQLYLDAFLVSGDGRHAAVVRDILDYVLRDMTHPEGGFYSAEDADSEGQEGKFYCWTLEELTRLLSPEELRIAERYYGITPQGNFVDHSHPDPLRGLNVLSVVAPNVTSEEKDLLEAAKTKMRSARAMRVRPHLDDKVLSSWNGLMLGAFARAGVVLREPRYLEAAERNATFIRKRLWDADAGRLFHRWRGGERDSVQLLEAYAFLLSGVLDLYEATLVPQYLEWACALADSMLDGFKDSQQGGFWQSAADDGQLILRIKEDQDGAEPSGNSVAALSLLRVGKIAARDEYTEAGRRVLQHLSDRLGQFPQAVPCLLQALDFHLVEPCRALLVGPVAGAPVKELLPAIHGMYQPNKVVLGTQGLVDPFARSLESREKKGLYLCTGSNCQEPTDDPAKVKTLMRTPAVRT